MANSARARCRVNFVAFAIRSATQSRSRRRIDGTENRSRLRQLREGSRRGKGATLRLTYTDARRGSKQADLCDDCAGQMPGRAAARRGRRPKSAAASVTHLSRSFRRRGLLRRSEPSDRPGLRWAHGSGRGLTLLAGPANAGKVALLLERYLARARPRAGADRAERGRTSTASSASCSPAAARSSAARSGRSTTSSSGSRAATARTGPVATDAQRALIVRRRVAAASLNGLGALGALRAASPTRSLPALAELESGPLEPGRPRRRPRALYAAYRAELDRLGLWDRDLLRRHAAERARRRARRLAAASPSSRTASRT